MNPFYWIADFIGNWINEQESGYFTWGSESPDDDIFLAIFGEDIYGAYWRMFVYTASAPIAFMNYWKDAFGSRGLSFIIPKWLPDWIKDLIKIPTQ